MPWIAAAIGGVAAIAGGAISKSGAENAADKTAAAADRTAQVTKEMYDTTRNDLMPFTRWGQSAADRIGAIYGLPGGGSAPQAAPTPAPQQPSIIQAMGSEGAGVGPGGLPPGYTYYPPKMQYTEQGSSMSNGFLYGPDGNIVTSADTVEAAMAQAGITPMQPGVPGQAQPAMPGPTPPPWQTAGSAGALPGPGSSVNPYAIPNNGQFDMSVEELRKTPGHEFMLAEGLRAVDRSAAARGNLLGGRTMREGARYASNLADTSYMHQAGVFNDNVNRAIALNDQYFKSNINPLFDIAKMGANTGAQVGQIGDSSARTAALVESQAATAGAKLAGDANSAFTGGINNAVNSGIYAYTKAQENDRLRTAATAAAAPAAGSNLAIISKPEYGPYGSVINP